VLFVSVSRHRSGADEGPAIDFSLTTYAYAALTTITSVAAFVVAVRLVMRTGRSAVTGSRRMMLMLGAISLAVAGATGLFDVFDNIIVHPSLPILASSWAWSITGLVMVVWFEVFGRFAVEAAQLEHRLAALATTDALTGMLNRRAFLARADALIAQARRLQHPLTLLILDLDNFKSINDTYGHAAGDAVLGGVARAVASQLREVDVFGRIGGEEFGILMPAADRGGGLVAAERLRRAVEAAEIRHHGITLRTTASFGLAMLSRDCSRERLLGAADAALYAAKRQGRNKVIVASIESSAPKSSTSKVCA
jgi:diguanylate cyclase (GGDEF)-like protein